MLSLPLALSSHGCRPSPAAMASRTRSRLVCIRLLHNIVASKQRLLGMVPILVDGVQPHSLGACRCGGKRSLGQLLFLGHERAGLAASCLPSFGLCGTCLLSSGALPWLVAAAQKCPRTDTSTDVARFAINGVVELALVATALEAWSATDQLTCAMLSLAPALVFLRALRLTKLSNFVLSLCEGALSYLVLCAGHSMSESMLMLLVMTECATFKSNIKMWGTINIKAEATFKVAFREAEVDKSVLDQNMHIAELLEAVNASGLAVGMRLCSVGGLLVRNVAKAHGTLDEAFNREIECEHVDVVASGRPLPVGAEAAFQKLRSQVYHWLPPGIAWRAVKMCGKELCWVGGSAPPTRIITCMVPPTSRHHQPNEVVRVMFNELGNPPRAPLKVVQEEAVSTVELDHSLPPP
mmetsp:Transcript_152649/g.487754  ORF Transcript_152649/g.487754 Transcript_152649/m.487754 type:complete len:409 (+) Transcript_152649:329-1555(+)